MDEERQPGPRSVHVHVSSPPSHLKADFPGLSEQGLRGQVGVRVRPPQVRGAACGLDGHLVRGRGFQPGRRVWRWTETPRVHGRVVEFFATSILPVALHRPELRGERERNKNGVDARGVIVSVFFRLIRKSASSSLTVFPVITKNGEGGGRRQQSIIT